MGSGASQNAAPSNPNKNIEEAKASFQNSSQQESAPGSPDAVPSSSVPPRKETREERQLKKLAVGATGYNDVHREYDAKAAMAKKPGDVNAEDSAKQGYGTAQFTEKDMVRLAQQGKGANFKAPPPRQPPPNVTFGTSNAAGAKPQPKPANPQATNTVVHSPPPSILPAAMAPSDAPPPRYANPGAPQMTQQQVARQQQSQQQAIRQPAPLQQPNSVKQGPAVPSKLSASQKKYAVTGQADVSDDSDEEGENPGEEDLYDWIDDDPGENRSAKSISVASYGSSAKPTGARGTDEKPQGTPQGGGGSGSQPGSTRGKLNLKVDIAIGKNASSSSMVEDDSKMGYFADDAVSSSSTPTARPRNVPVLNIPMGQTPSGAQYKPVDVASSGTNPSVLGKPHPPGPNGPRGAPIMAVSPHSRPGAGPPSPGAAHSPIVMHGPRPSVGSPVQGGPHGGPNAAMASRGSIGNSIYSSTESVVSIGAVMRGSADQNPYTTGGPPTGPGGTPNPFAAGQGGTPLAKHGGPRPNMNMGPRMTPPRPMKNVVPHAVKETTDVKRNKIQMPTNMAHAKPTAGNWLKKRYIVNNYIMLDTLGAGSYAEVRLCKDRTTENLYAMKIFSRDLLKKKKHSHQAETFFDDIRREVAIMKKLVHPNVLRLYEVLDDPNVNKMYLVLEYMKNGDLITLLERERKDGKSTNSGRETEDKKESKNKTMHPLPEGEVWNIFRQVAAGIRYLHFQNVVHGDIKPQNLLVSEQGIIKIADFGISKMLSDGEAITDGAGTPAFMSPELCAGGAFSGQLADVWALGATIFMLKFGHPPWVATNVLNLYNKIQTEPLVFPSTYHIDPGLKDLLTRMMIKNPDERFTIQQCLQHPWFRQPPPPSKFRPPEKLTEHESVSQSEGAVAVKQSSSATPMAQSFFAKPLPPSYHAEQESASNQPVVTDIDQKEMQMSIGVRFKDHLSSKDPGAKPVDTDADADIDDLFKTNVDDGEEDDEDDDDDDALVEYGGEKAEAKEEAKAAEEEEEDVMLTNWGDDVFEMVDDGDHDDDDDDDDDDGAMPPGKSVKAEAKAQDSAQSTAESVTAHVEMTDAELQRRQNKFQKKNKHKSTKSLLTVSDQSKHSISGASNDFGADAKESSKGPVKMGNRPPSIAQLMAERKASTTSTDSTPSVTPNKGGSKLRPSSKGRKKYDDDEDDEDDDDVQPMSIGDFSNMMDTLACQPEKKTPHHLHGPPLVVKINKIKIQAEYMNSFNDVKFAFHCEQGNRTGQEDRCVVIPNVAKLRQFGDQHGVQAEVPVEGGVCEELLKFSIVCVFDGHGGDSVSQHLHDNFVNTLTAKYEQLMSQQQRNLSQLLTNTFEEMDSEMCKVLRDSDDEAGSTGVVAVYDGRRHTLTVANVGDSSCVLCMSDGTASRALKMHRLSDTAERERVLKANARIIGNRYDNDCVG